MKMEMSRTRPPCHPMMMLMAGVVSGPLQVTAFLPVDVDHPVRHRDWSNNAPPLIHEVCRSSIAVYGKRP
jgi:hypothetical protein